MGKRYCHAVSASNMKNCSVRALANLIAPQGLQGHRVRNFVEADKVQRAEAEGKTHDLPLLFTHKYNQHSEHELVILTQGYSLDLINEMRQIGLKSWFRRIDE